MTISQEFTQEKEILLRKLNDLKEIIKNSNYMPEEDVSLYMEKIDRVMKEVENEKLKLVFFGSFSSGKSTILSSLTENLSIKIAPEPTTDKVQACEYRDFLLVDTPGLFSEKIPHDELTIKYISEADLIIFVTEAENPLKESQHEVIKWILKDLGKINQTIFVVNKMDNIADITDREDFEKNCKIKKEVIKDTIEKLTGNRIEDKLIICLSADPNGMGLDYWFERKEEYREYSNIEALEVLINSVVNEKKENLRKNTIEAVLRDLNIRGLEIIKEKRN